MFRVILALYILNSFFVTVTIIIISTSSVVATVNS
jgi:hypothetical protein